MESGRVAKIIATILVFGWFIAASVAAMDAVAARFGDAVHPDRPAVYVLDVRLFQEYDGADSLLLTYALSGAVQAVAFREPVKLEAYLAYLNKLGAVEYAGEIVDLSGAGL